MSEGDKSTKVTTEGSAAVLNRVKGRLEKVEVGDLPKIERVGPDGKTHLVDHTGEMVRPTVDAAADEAARAAAEAFAAEHRAGSAPSPSGRPAPVGSLPPTSAPKPPTPDRGGLWARIMGWFRRS